MKKILALLILMVVVAAVPAAAGQDEKASSGEKQETSHEFAYYTYLEDAGGIKLLVDSRTAMWRQEEKYIPLQIALGVFPLPKEKGEKGHHKGRTITVSLDDFTLVDEKGDSYPTALYRQIIDDYQYRDADRDWMRQNPINTGDLFVAGDVMVGAFYPAVTGPVAPSGAVELPAFSAFRDIIYFPNPAGGTRGVLTLRLSVQDLSEPVEVKFSIPVEPPHKDHEDKKKHEKKHED